MTASALLFTLAAIGISETVYLIRKRILSEKPVCFIGEDCAFVLSSKYNKIFIIPNDVLGLLFYLVISFITAFLVIGVEPAGFWHLASRILIASGALMSFIFTYLQWKVVGAWCFWCVMSAFTIWFMGVIILISGLKI